MRCWRKQFSYYSGIKGLPMDGHLLILMIRTGVLAETGGLKYPLHNTLLSVIDILDFFKNGRHKLSNSPGGYNA